MHLIAPTIALVTTGVLVGNQRVTISKLENESVYLRERIAEEKGRIESFGTAGDPARPARPETANREIDWVDVAGMFREMKTNGGVGDMRKMMSFQSRIQKMDKEQLLAALAQVQALRLEDEDSVMLEAMLIGPLTVKDPELVLNRFSDRIGDEQSGMGWQLANAIGEWAKRDRVSAIAWFDKQIAAGTFDSKSLDGKSHVRLVFETNLIAQLVSSDPSLAGARIADLPSDQRKDVLGGFKFHSLKDEEQKVHADLVRSNLSEREIFEVLGQQASTIGSMRGLEQVGEYLDRIGATAEERTLAAERAANDQIMNAVRQSKVSEEKVDSMREWLGTQAPESVDKVTGQALGQIATRQGSSNYTAAMAMVLKYHEEGGGDGLLTGFLERTRHSGKTEESRRIAEMISDPEKREKVLENYK